MQTSTKKIKPLTMLKTAFLVIAVFISAFILPSACAPAKEGNISKYTIVASYDEEAKQIDALLTLDYVNNYDVELKELKFHLYPRAYRQDAQFSPIEASSKGAAYPSGINYGDLTVLSVLRNGTETDINIEGSDQDILNVLGEIKPTERVTIEIDFRLTLPVIRHRFGWYDGIANLGNWYPIACVYKNGAFETSPYYFNGDPFISEIANYEVSIVTKENLSVAMSGKQKTSIKDGKKTTTASIEKARDFAAVIGEFKIESQTRNGIEVNYYYKEAEGENPNRPATEILPANAVNLSFDALATFTDIYGEYAYDSLAVVKTPFLHGGMEYPALIYISDMNNESAAAEVIIHEIAHQWWYAAVGSNQITQAWLDEALAEYSTTIFYERNKTYGILREARISDAWKNYVVFCDLFKENGKGDTSMNRKVFEYATPLEYSTLTYVKGQLMLDTLRSGIGDEAFFAGFKSYYNKYTFKTASVDEFIAELENASKTQLKGFFDSWLSGKVIAPAA